MNDLNVTMIVGSQHRGGIGDRLFVAGWVHGETPDVFLRLEDDDVHFWCEEAYKRHGGAQANRNT